MIPSGYGCDGHTQEKSRLRSSRYYGKQYCLLLNISARLTGDAQRTRIARRMILPGERFSFVEDHWIEAAAFCPATLENELPEPSAGSSVSFSPVLSFPSPTLSCRRFRSSSSLLPSARQVLHYLLLILRTCLIEIFRKIFNGILIIFFRKPLRIFLKLLHILFPRHFPVSLHNIIYVVAVFSPLFPQIFQMTASFLCDGIILALPSLELLRNKLSDIRLSQLLKIGYRVDSLNRCYHLHSLTNLISVGICIPTTEDQAFVSTADTG